MTGKLCAAGELANRNSATLTLFRVGALVSPQAIVDAGMQSPPALERPPMLRRPIGWVDDPIDDERGCGEGGMIPARTTSVCKRGFTGCPGSTNRRTDERHLWSTVPGGCPQSTCCSQLGLTSCAERLESAVHSCSMQCRRSADAVECAACTYISTYRMAPDRIECTYFRAFASAPSGDATTRCVTTLLRTVQTEPPSCRTRICSRFISVSEP